MEIKSGIDVKQMEKVAYILKTVAHPLRLGIVQMLHKNEALSVNEICERLDAEQSLTSHHLATMKLKGILDCEQSGRQRYYSLKERSVYNILQCLENCDCNM